MKEFKQKVTNIFAVQNMGRDNEEEIMAAFDAMGLQFQVIGEWKFEIQGRLGKYHWSFGEWLLWYGGGDIRIMDNVKFRTEFEAVGV